MLSFRAHAWICGGLFAAMIGLAILGNVLQGMGVIAPAGIGKPVAFLFFGLFLAFGFSCIPVMVKLVFGFQRKRDEAGQPAVNIGSKAETILIWIAWAFLAVACAVAIPAAIMNGMFDTQPPASAPTAPPNVN